MYTGFFSGLGTALCGRDMSEDCFGIATIVNHAQLVAKENHCASRYSGSLNIWEHTSGSSKLQALQDLRRAVIVPQEA